MPWVEHTLASYLSLEGASSLKFPMLPKPRSTLALVGKAGPSLHTIAVLQAYQADLLKDLDSEDGLEENTRSPPGHRSVPQSHQGNRQS